MISISGLFDIVAILALLGGIFFMFVGALGVLRLPDAYNRIHAASKCTTLGLSGLLLAICLHMPEASVLSKSLLTIVFTFVATPIGSHLLSKAAHHGHLELWDRTLRDELAIDKADPNMAVSDDQIDAPEIGPVPDPADQRHVSVSTRGAA